MIDVELLGLVRHTQGKLKALGKDAKPSQILAMKEAFAENALIIVNRAGVNITDAEKIAAFDKLLVGQVAVLTEEITGRYRDDDSDHYAYEAVVQAVFGNNIFDATNEFDNLLPKGK